MKSNIPYPRHRFVHSPETELVKREVQNLPQNMWWKYGFTYSPRIIESSTSYRPNSEVIDDVVVPGYKLRSAHGEVFNNPYSKFVKTMAISGQGTYNYYNIDAFVSTGLDEKFLYEFYQARQSSGVTPQLVFPDEVQSERNAQIQCLASVNQTDFDSLTFAAEWSKTKILHREVGQALLKLFLDPKSGLLFATKLKYKKARVKRVPLYDHEGRPLLNKKGGPTYKYVHTEAYISGKSSSGKDVANAYLVGRYGVGPLLHDLEGALKHLTKSRALRKTARGTYSLNASATMNFNASVFGESVPGQWLRNGEKTVRYGIYYETTAFMSGAAGLGLTRPLKTIWELIPYSFVFDWLINVGGWLDAIQPSGATKELSAWVSTRSMTYDYLNCSGGATVDKLNQSSADHWSWNAASTLVSTETAFSRQIWTPSVPKFPALGSGLNPLRSFDLMTLIVQKIRSS